MLLFRVDCHSGIGTKFGGHRINNNFTGICVRTVIKNYRKHGKSYRKFGRLYLCKTKIKY